MRKVLLAIMIGLLSLSFFAVSDVEAKRFGGGKSFGVSRSISKPINKPGSAFNKTAPAAGAVAAAAPKPASRWLGPLAGMAIGGLLAALLMGHGFGTGLLLWLGIGLIVFLIVRAIMRRMSAANFQTQTNNGYSAANNSFAPQAAAHSKPQHAHPNFDEAGFLRQSKLLFIRLQAAYDNKNLLDIREFTSTEVFAEIQMQLHERGDTANQTEVINIDAELVDLNLDVKPEYASVLFSGLVREQPGADPVEINEIWHFRKNIFNANWIVAGIQQDA